MLGDNERSNAYASEQGRMVRVAVAAEVLAFTPYWREAASEAGLNRPTAATDLLALPPRPLSALGPPDALVLRPSPEAVRKSGPRPLRRQLRRSRVGRGRTTAVSRILDPLYKPVHWMIEGETPVGCTEADLMRLAELGRRSLELAGITPNDAIVGLVPPGPTLSAWQLALGARDAGVPLAGLSPSTSLEAVAMLGPTVLAGRPVDLLRVLHGVAEAVRSSIVTVLAVTRSPLGADDRSTLEEAVGGQASVVELWSPPGVRALWAQCRGGEGVHTWPQSELLEVCEPDGTPVAPGEEGELVWTGLGWRGTVLVRLATGMRGRVVEGSCGVCGRTTPRILDARPMAGRNIADASDLVVSPTKATGAFESVRTVRAARKPKAAVRVAAQDEAFAAVPAAPEDEPAVPVRTAAQEEPAGTVRAVPKEEPKEEPAGTVRAVPKEEADIAPGPQSGAARGGSAIGEVDHLPPVPEVGPDASGDDPDYERVDPWLPETGEVDAWPAPVLESIEGLAAWQVEHRRRSGHDEMVVHMALSEGAELGEVLIALERMVGATQYVVSDEARVNLRVSAADGRRIVDRRARRTTNGNGRPRPRVSAGRPSRDS